MSNWRNNKRGTEITPGNQDIPKQPGKQSGKNHGKTPSWKQMSRTESSTGSGRYWVSGGVKRSRFREVALLIMLIGIVGIGAVFSVMIWRQDRSTPCLIVAGLDYPSPWMPNSWFREDIERFESWFDGSAKEQSLFCVARTTPENGRWDEILHQQLKSLTPGGPGGSILPFRKYQSIVIFLSAHGIVRNGSPRLVFGKDEVGFEEVLALLAKDDRLRNVRTLLVVDSGKQRPDIRLALLKSDFAGKAAEVVKRQASQHLAVLFSASSNEIAWSAPELNGTVFGSIFARAFLGAADEDRNNRITVLELERFIANEVAGYASRTRRAKQSPFLVWSQDQPQDFEIAYCHYDERRELESELRADPKSVDPPGIEGLTQAWKAFEPWRQQTLKGDPWKVASVRADLCWADQLIWGGKQYNALAQSVTMRAKEMMKPEVDRMVDLPGSSRGSFENVTDKDGSTAADSTADGSDDAERIGATAKVETAPSANLATPAQPPASDSEKTSAFLAAAKNFLEQPVDAEGKPKLPPKASSMKEFLAFAWPWLEQPVASHWSRDGLARLFTILPDDRGNSQSIRAEDAFLLAIHEDLTRVGEDWEKGQGLSEASASLLVAFRNIWHRAYPKIEKEPRVLAKVKSQLNGLEAKLRRNRDALHARIVFDPISLDESTSLIALIDEETRRIELLDLLEDEVTLAVDWQVDSSVVEMVEQIISFLRSSDTDREPIEKLVDIREKLLAAYIDEVHTLGSAKALEPESFQKLQLHLMHLPVNAEERDLLHGKLSEHLTALVGSDVDLKESQSDRKPTDFVTLNASTEILGRLARLEGFLEAIDLKDLDQEKSKQFLDTVNSSRGWRLAKDETREDLESNARKVRLYCNLLPGKYATPDLEFDAARELDVQVWHDYLLERSDSSVQDFWVYPRDSIRSEFPYFRLSGEAFLRAAKGLTLVPRPRLLEAERLVQQYEQFANAWPSLLIQGNWKEVFSQDDSKRTVRVPWETAQFPKGEARISYSFSEAGKNRFIIADALSVGEIGSSWTNSSTTLPQELSIVADYRGHRAERRVTFARREPLWVLQNDVPQLTDAIVRIDNPLQPVEIVFALDCSNSFSPGDFKKAIAALSSALRQFKERSNVKVSLVAFGHSRTFPGLREESQKQLGSNAAGENIAWSEKYPQKAGNRFDDDAVVLETLAPATDEHIQSIESYFADLRPFGATPLYYAIERSKSLLDASFKANPDQDVLRRVVVITDGVNDVTAKNKDGKPATDPLYQVKTNRSIADVYRVFENGAVAQIDVILIDVKKQTNDTELRDLTEKFSGKYRVSDFDQLGEDLANALNPRRVSIVHRGEIRSEDIVAKKFGEFRVPGLPLEGVAEGRNLIVSSDGKELARLDLGLLGGERVKIEFDAQRKSFAFPFRRPNSVSRNLGQGMLAWRVPPRSDARDVRFVLDRVSGSEQTLRPSMVFVEVASNTLQEFQSRGETVPERAFWTSQVVWESFDDCRPACRVSVEKAAESKNVSELPARLWVRTGPLEELAVFPTKDISGTELQVALESLDSTVGVSGRSATSGYAVVLRLPAAVASRVVVSMPSYQSVRHEFFEDKSVQITFDYVERPSGELRFYPAPNGAGETGWESTDWLELTPGEEGR